MGKRNYKSKYRSLGPDSPESGTMVSPRIRDEATTNPSPHLASGRVNRAPGIFDRPTVRRSVSVPSHEAFEVSGSPDNIHSSYHLHSSDHPGLILVSDLLDGNNYSVWYVAMLTSLEDKNKLGFLDGSIVKPAEDDLYHCI